MIQVIDQENYILKNEQLMNIKYNFKVSESVKRKIELLLYKLPDKKNVYLSLHLRVNVK